MRYLFSLILIALSLSANSQTISTDRPTQAFGTSTMGKGYFQIETGLGIDVFSQTTAFSLGATQLRYGITDNFEFRTNATIGISNEWATKINSWDGSMGAGFKWNIVNKKVSFSYLAEAIIPLYPDIVKVHNAFLLGHDVTDKVSFGYMLYYNYDFAKLGTQTTYNTSQYTYTADYIGNLQFSYVVNFQLLEKLTFFMEMSVMSDLVNPDGITLLYDAGLMYLIKDNLQIDFFFGTGILHKRGTYGVGVSWMAPNPNKKITPPVE